MQVVLTPDGSGLACRILRAAPGKWHTHATCRLEAEGEDDHGATPTWVAPRGAVQRGGRALRQLPGAGSGLWAGLSGLTHCTAPPVRPGAWWCCPPAWDPHGYLVHPALLDACLQVTAAALDDMPDAWIPGANRAVPRRGDRAIAHTSARPRDASTA